MSQLNNLFCAHVDELHIRLLETHAYLILSGKVNILRSLLSDYRRTHSLSVSDPEYYGTALLEALMSFMRLNNIRLPQDVDINDPSTLVILSRASKNDNIILRMVAFYIARLTSQQVEQFEVWVQPLDLA